MLLFPLVSLRTKLELLAIVSATAVVALAVHGTHEAEAARVVSDVTAYNVAAQLHRTIALDSGALRVLAANAAGVTRQAVQQQQRADSLDRALHWQRAATATLDVRLRGAEGTGQGVVTSGAAADAARTAHVDVFADPFTVHADVVLSDSSHVRMTARVDAPPLALNVRLGCRDVPGNAARRADVVVTGPAWAAVDVSDVEQDVGICNPTSSASRASRSHVSAALTFGYGAAYDAQHARVVTGPAAVAGVALHF